MRTIIALLKKKKKNVTSDNLIPIISVGISCTFLF